MNPREKKLLGIIGGIVGVILVLAGIHAFVVSPLKDLDKRANATRGGIAKAQEERRKFFAAEDRVKSYTARTFADTVERASAAAGEMITKEISNAGLSESDFARLPVGPRKLRGASEIGWSVQGEGALTNVVDLLFVLGSTPHLKQMDGLTISPSETPGRVKVRFRYLTLVIDPAPDVERTNLVAKATLESPERAQLNVIASRDLLRPYIKRRPEPPTRGKPAESAPTQAAPGPETFKVVSLSNWDGAPEAHVLNSSNNKTQRYAPGDELAGGRIVMIDYRPMPHPTRPTIQSLSRLIVKIGDEHWAIERGSTLAEKRLLKKEDLPPGLASVGQ